MHSRTIKINGMKKLLIAGIALFGLCSAVSASALDCSNTPEFIEGATYTTGTVV